MAPGLYNSDEALKYATTLELLQELESRLTVRFKGHKGMALGIACRNACETLDPVILSYFRAVDEEIDDEELSVFLLQKYRAIYQEDLT